MRNQWSDIRASETYSNRRSIEHRLDCLLSSTQADRLARRSRSPVEEQTVGENPPAYMRRLPCRRLRPPIAGGRRRLNELAEMFNKLNFLDFSSRRGGVVD